MNPAKILTSLALALALLLTGTSAFAEPPRGMPPHPGMFHPMGVSGISGDQQHLYVLAGGKIMQYSLADLKLLKTVDLPKPVPPSAPPTSFTSKGQVDWSKFPPPPFAMAGLHGFWVGNGALYVLDGPKIYRYSTPDLTLKNTAELPRPELPKAEN